MIHPLGSSGAEGGGRVGEGRAGGAGAREAPPRRERPGQQVPLLSQLWQRLAQASGNLELCARHEG